MSLPGIMKEEPDEVEDEMVKKKVPSKVAATKKVESPKYLNACPHCVFVYTYWEQESHLLHMWKQHYKTVKCHSCYKTYPIKYPWGEVGVQEPQTQKAKGIYALVNHYSGSCSVASPVCLLSAKEEILGKGKTIIASLLPKFVRPCPPKPEHGFVESREVKTIEELEELRKETLAANEDSEIMLMDKIDAVANCVWTPYMIAFGPGHDGATSGKGAVSMPLAGLNPLSKDCIKAAGMAPGSDPYVEAVCVSNEDAYGNPATLTQLRGGPKLASGIDPDFIPEPLLVTEVVKTNGEDLLEWAKMVKLLKSKPGVVVWHPGGALTDHYSVHCRENQVPIVISFEPVVGTTIQATTEIPPLDPQEVLKGLYVGDTVHLKSSYAGFVRIALLALHNSVVMRGPHSFWIGVGVAALLKLGPAALEAEARHAHMCYKGMKNKPDIYEYYTSRKMTFLRARLSRVTQILHYGFGDPETPKSYGGRKWALCGAALCPLFNSVRDLALKPTEENASKLLLALNVAINQAHNGGWWLNKFIEVSAYDNVPKGEIGEACAAAQAVLLCDQERTKLDSKKFAKFLSTVSKWPDSMISPLKWRKAELDITPGAFVLNLKASTLPIPRTITIPTTPAMVKSLLSAIGEIKIERGKIDLICKEGETINIWTEAPLEAEARNVHRK